MLRSVLLVALAFTQQPISSPGDGADESAIRAIVAEQLVAWNSGDGKRYSDHLAPDASFTTWT